MPYRTTQYTGKFDVLSISNSQREVLEDGITVKQNNRVTCGLMSKLECLGLVQIE